MKYVYFNISAIFSETGADKLNAFISSHAVTSVKEHFVEDGQNSFWSVRVAVAENLAKTTVDISKPSKQTRIDYRETLSPEVFAVYAKLRTLRNSIAEQQSVPAYAIFTNDQLAEMASLENPNKTSIAEINGIGEKRLALYVDQFLAILQKQNG